MSQKSWNLVKSLIITGVKTPLEVSHFLPLLRLSELGITGENIK